MQLYFLGPLKNLSQGMSRRSLISSSINCAASSIDCAGSAASQALRVNMSINGPSPEPAKHAARFDLPAGVNHLDCTFTLVTFFFERFGTVSCVSPQMTTPSCVRKPAIMVTACLFGERGGSVPF